ncbi:hypothetical protein BCR35DRAFT_90669 [Leucosporidium creatinivorum]|uniref:Uncharacterized protein n=1 Tax=Leucosporidium creatinivorum TaxID=106004 RepID=A0A1Y2FA18_9BASI|nr:hypothetical protein BCR35DRAFT_90669 [Leucosporidium creatinivorum]
MLAESAFLDLDIVRNFTDGLQMTLDRAGWEASREAVMLEMASKETELKLAIFNKVASAEASLEPIAPTYTAHPPLKYPVLPHGTPPRRQHTLVDPLSEEIHLLVDSALNKPSRQLLCTSCKITDAYPNILYHFCHPITPALRPPPLWNGSYPSATKLANVESLNFDPRRAHITQALLNVAELWDDKRGLAAVSKMNGKWSCGVCWEAATDGSAEEHESTPMALDFNVLVTHLVESHWAEPVGGRRWKLPKVFYETTKAAAARKENYRLARLRMDESA